MTKKLAIVVADRGWVYIGNVEQTGNGVSITDAQNLRRWGTTAGLGQLAHSGPQGSTTLDAYGSVFVPSHAVISIIDVTNREAWSAYFPLHAAAA